MQINGQTVNLLFPEQQMKPKDINVMKSKVILSNKKYKVVSPIKTLSNQINEITNSDKKSFFGGFAEDMDSFYGLPVSMATDNSIDMISSDTRS